MVSSIFGRLPSEEAVVIELTDVGGGLCLMVDMLVVMDKLWWMLVLGPGFVVD